MATAGQGQPSPQAQGLKGCPWGVGRPEKPESADFLGDASGSFCRSRFVAEERKHGELCHRREGLESESRAKGGHQWSTWSWMWEIWLQQTNKFRGNE